MKQRRLKTAEETKPVLRVVKSIKEDAPDVDQLVRTAWNFAYTALWNNSIFSRTEIRIARNRIREFLLACKTPTIGYKVFCQRVLLARYYVNNGENRYIPVPSIWLDKENPTGFTGTKEWYENIKAVRSSLPNYKAELRAFAEAILEMKEDPTSENFQYWRNYFIEKKMPGLLTLFLTTVANQQYGI